MKRLLTFLLFAVLFPASAGATLRIVATTPDLAVLLRQLGGGAVEVTSIVKPSQDAHQIAAKPSHMRVLHDADWVVAIGLDLEPAWLPRLLLGARNPRVRPGTAGFTDASQWIEPIEVPHGPVDRSQGDVHPYGNPHYMLSPDNLLAVARGLAAELASRLPENADAIQHRQSEWEARFEKRMEAWRQALAPFAGTPVVVYHKSFNYLLGAFGLKLAGTIEPKPGIPPTPQHLRELQQQIERQNIRVMLIEPFYDPTPAQTIAQRTGARVLQLPIQPGADDSVPDSLAVIDRIVNELAGALR